MARDYKKEYKKFQSSKQAKRDRARRNTARRRENAKRKKQGKEPLPSNVHVSHVTTKSGRTILVLKPASKNLGSKKDTKGDKKARGNGQKKKQPKGKRRNR